MTWEYKIRWEQKGKELIARLPVAPRGFETFLREEDFIPIQEWCFEHNCGKRTSFDTFRFKNSADITAFLLRWS